MKRELKFYPWTMTAIILPSVLLSSCKYGSEGDKSGGDDSIIAAVGGISDSDISLNLNIKLLCKDSGGQVSRPPVDGLIEEKTKIVFKNASEIKPTDKCAFEARLPEAKIKEPPFKDYQWYASKGEQKEIGLMYASQVGEVTDARKLTIEVFKVYDPPADPNGFQAVVKIALPEDRDVTIANLKGCAAKDGKSLDNAVGEVSGNAGTGTSRSLTFNLSKDYIDGKCTSISVLDNVAKQSYTLQNVSGLDFTGVKVKDTATYPKDGSEFKLTKDSTSAPSSPTQPGLDVTAKDKGECKNFDAVNRVCKDAVKGPTETKPVSPSTPSAGLTAVAKTSKPTLLQLIAIKNGTPEILYMSGKDGIGGLSVDISLDSLNKGGVNLGNSSFFKPAKPDFNPKVLIGKPLLSSDRSGSILGQKLGDLKDYKFTKIHAGWSQSFVEISRVNLDKVSEPTWFAKIAVTKNGVKETLFVTKTNLISSLKDKIIPPGKTAQESTYFNWEGLTKSEAKGFTIYHMKKCGRNSEEVEKMIVSEWSNKAVDEYVNAITKSFENCKISGTDDLIKGGWQQAEAKFYQLKWELLK